MDIETEALQMEEPESFELLRLLNRLSSLLPPTKKFLRRHWVLFAVVALGIVGLGLIFFPTFEDVFYPVVPIPPSFVALGSKDAEVTVVEFASPGCTECALFHRDVFPLLMQEYVNPGKVRFVFRILTNSSEDAEAAALGECVRSNNYLAFMDLLFRNQNTWSQVSSDEGREAGLIAYAQIAGVDRDRAIACMSSRARLKGLAWAATDAQKTLGLDHVPAFVIGYRVYNTALSWAELKKAIDARLEVLRRAK